MVQSALTISLRRSAGLFHGAGYVVHMRTVRYGSCREVISIWFGLQTRIYFADNLRYPYIGDSTPYPAVLRQLIHAVRRDYSLMTGFLDQVGPSRGINCASCGQFHICPVRVKTVNIESRQQSGGSSGSSAESRLRLMTGGMYASQQCRDLMDCIGYGNVRGCSLLVIDAAITTW
jgi:hypothetical protein